MNWIKATYSWWGHPLNWWSNICESCRWLQQFFIRGAQGWCYADLWGLHEYLIEILIPALGQLKEIQHGYPVIDESLDEESAIKLWNEKLDTMIAGFEAAQRIVNDDWRNMDEFKREKATFKRGMREFTTYFFNLWD